MSFLGLRRSNGKRSKGPSKCIDGSVRVSLDGATLTQPHNDGARGRREREPPICQPKCLNGALRQGVDRSASPRVDDHTASLSPPVALPAFRDTTDAKTLLALSR